MRVELKPHPDTPCEAVRSLTVEVARVDEPYNLALAYLVEGDISRLAIPKREAEVRTNGLWRHTCFEAFIRAPSGDGYWELNFSPSTRWAAYRFDSYRTGMADAAVGGHWIDAHHSPEASELRAHMLLPSLPQPLVLALTAVIEEANGAKSYWALKHPPGKPDFHHADGFTLEIQ
jgi:hypothetical protein